MNNANNEILLRDFEGPCCASCTHPERWHKNGGVCVHCGCEAFMTRRTGRRRRGEAARPPVVHAGGARLVGAAALLEAAGELARAMQALSRAAQAVQEIITSGIEVEPPRRKPPAPVIPIKHTRIRQPAAHAMKSEPASEPGHLSIGALKVLTAIAERDGITNKTLRALTGFKRSTIDTYIVKLGGLVERVEGKKLVSTNEGRTRLGPDFKPLPRGRELREKWLRELGEGQSVVLELLIEAYPSPLAGTFIDERTGYARSTRDTYIVKLVSRGLVERLGGGNVRASHDLFDDSERNRST